MSDSRMPPTPPVLLARLHAVRWRIRLAIWLAGKAVLLGWFVLFVAVSLPLDRWFRLDVPQRAILLAAVAVLLLALAWRRLLRPLLFPLTDAFLCRRIEAKDPAFGGLLLGTLEFTTASVPGASPAMVAVTVGAGAVAAESISPERIVPPARIRRPLLHAAAFLLPLLAASVLMPETMGLWARRNLLLAQTPWPRQTHLRVEGLRDGQLAVPEGGDRQILVHAAGVMPEQLEIRYRLENGPLEREPMRRIGNAFLMEVRNVVEPMRMRVTGGDGDTGWFDLVVLPRPRLDGLTLFCHPPDYTRRETITLPAGRDLYTLPAQSRLTLRATATKPLAYLRVLHEGKDIATLGAGMGTTLEVALPAEAVQSGTYTLVFADTDGISPLRMPSFRLRVQPDQAPTVRLRTEEVGGMILDRARIPLSLHVQDDFGFSEARLEVTGSFEGIEGVVQEADLPLPEDAASRPEMTLPAVVDLQGIDRSLPPGTLLTLAATVRDTDTLTGPNEAVGSVSVRIVSEEEFLSELQLREQTMRQALLGMIRVQAEILEQTRIHHADAGTPSIQALRREERRQRLLARQLEPLTDRVERLVAEIRANRYEEEGGSYQTRLLEAVLAPLVTRAVPAIPAAASALDAASVSGEDRDVQRRHLQVAIREQSMILDTLRAVETQMARWESIQEAITILRELIDRQKRILDDTKRRHEEGLERLFD